MTKYLLFMFPIIIVFSIINSFTSIAQSNDPTLKMICIHYHNISNDYFKINYNMIPEIGPPIFHPDFYFLESNKSNKFHFIHLLDNDDSTSWVEGFKDHDGVALQIAIDFRAPAGYIEIDALRIKNGFYLKNYFTQNNRVKDIELDIHRIIGPKITDHVVFNKNIRLIDSFEWHTYSLGNAVKVDEHYGLLLTIKSVYPGTKWRDTAITDIQFLYKDKPIVFKKSKSYFSDTLKRWDTQRYKNFEDNSFRSFPCHDVTKE